MLVVLEFCIRGRIEKLLKPIHTLLLLCRPVAVRDFVG